MNIFKSIWNYKCPVCRSGNLFVEPFDMKNPLNMHETCSCCNQKFEPEPGYFFGAMFISYIWTGWLALTIVGVCMIVLNWSVEGAFTLLIFTFALMYFFILRVSRAIYIHIDMRYDEQRIKKLNC